MILVTLGTNDKRFDRLLAAVEKAVKEGIITDEVVVQAGYTSWQSDCIRVTDYLDREAFDEYIRTASLIICHGGVGTIMTGLKNRRKILAAARLQKYHEHVNDHQIQLLEAFEKRGYLIYMQDLDDIRPYLEKARDFEPEMYQSNTAGMVRLIEDWIEKN